MVVLGGGGAVSYEQGTPVDGDRARTRPHVFLSVKDRQDTWYISGVCLRRRFQAAKTGGTVSAEEVRVSKNSFLFERPCSGAFFGSL